MGLKGYGLWVNLIQRADPHLDDHHLVVRRLVVVNRCICLHWYPYPCAIQKINPQSAAGVVTFVWRKDTFRFWKRSNMQRFIVAVQVAPFESSQFWNQDITFQVQLGYVDTRRDQDVWVDLMQRVQPLVQPPTSSMTGRWRRWSCSCGCCGCWFWFWFWCWCPFRLGHCF
jgi:hypothetical protein